MEQAGILGGIYSPLLSRPVARESVGMALNCGTFQARCCCCGASDSTAHHQQSLLSCSGLACPLGGSETKNVRHESLGHIASCTTPCGCLGLDPTRNRTCKLSHRSGIYVRMSRRAALRSVTFRSLFTPFSILSVLPVTAALAVAAVPSLVSFKCFGS